jgi:hypothetical protein
MPTLRRYLIITFMMFQYGFICFDFLGDKLLNGTQRQILKSCGNQRSEAVEIQAW